MRESYNNLIQKAGISNILHYLPDLSYSKKADILFKLLEHYDVPTINVSLEEYHQQYIKLNRVDNLRVLNTLKGLCERKTHSKI